MIKSQSRILTLIGAYVLSWGSVAEAPPNQYNAIAQLFKTAIHSADNWWQQPEQ